MKIGIDQFKTFFESECRRPVKEALKVMCSECGAKPLQRCQCRTRRYDVMKQRLPAYALAVDGEVQLFKHHDHVYQALKDVLSAPDRGSLPALASALKVYAARGIPGAVRVGDVEIFIFFGEWDEGLREATG